MPWLNLDDAVHTMRLCGAVRRGIGGVVGRGRIEGDVPAV